MLSTGAFLGGSGEMERLRAGNLALPSNGEKAGKDAQNVQKGDSFPEMLESIQKDGAGKAAGEGQIASRAEDALEAREEQGGRISGGGAKSLEAAQEKDGELDASLSPDAVLLLQAAESLQVSSINIDLADIAEKKAEDEANAAFAAAALEAAEKGAGFAVVAGEAANGAKGERGIQLPLDAALREGAGLFEKQGANNPENTESLLAEAEGVHDKAFISVRDLRSATRLTLKAGAADGDAAQGSAYSSSADAEMHLHFSLNSALEGEALAGKEGGSAWQASGFSLQGARLNEGAAGASFAERLAAELRSSAPDIVRAGQIVLKDGGEGTIRLALQPETLGAVRIHLEMSGDKKIAGKITVSSREAWDAFSESMESLVAAFADEGFDAAGFDLSWAGHSGGSGSGKVSAPFYASSIPDVIHDGDFSDDYSVASAARRSDALYAVDIFA